MKRAFLFALMVVAVLATFAGLVFAKPPKKPLVPLLADAAPKTSAAPAPVAAPAPAPVDADAGASIAGCVENVPKGAQRPGIIDTFPVTGKSGWAAILGVTVRHHAGERVLPSGLDLGSALEAKKLLKTAGFVVPEQDGGLTAQLWSDDKDKKGRSASNEVTTHFELPLVVLPTGPGRNVMTLPPLPVAIARANGELMTVCTHPHVITVDDPTANTPEPMPHGNPPPRKQTEEWTALKKAVTWGGLGLLAGALLAYVLYKHLTKPKPTPPPPPPRPPWDIALERLDEVRHAGLLEVERYTDYFDRTSDAVRGYLGARFGFDGLESTTDEILTALERQAGGFVRVGDGVVMEGGFGASMPMPGVPVGVIASFLRECDLVKFANLTPTPDQCARAIDQGEAIVRMTIPGAPPPRPSMPAPPRASVPAPRPPSAPPPPPDPDAAYRPPPIDVAPPLVTGPPPPPKKDGES